MSDSYQDSGQPRTQGLSSIRPLSRSRDGKNRDPGNQVGFSLLCQFKERFLSFQVTCHFSFQSRSLSLLANNMQTNEFQERKQKHCVLWPKCLLHRRRFETDFTSIETVPYTSPVFIVCLSPNPFWSLHKQHLSKEEKRKRPWCLVQVRTFS